MAQKTNEIKNEVKEVKEEVKTENNEVNTTPQENLPAETEKQSFSERHPKIAAVGGKAKKVGKWVGLATAFVGGIFIANKLGERNGFDKAFDAFNSNNSNNEDDISEESCGLDPEAEITEYEVVETGTF